MCRILEYVHTCNHSHQVRISTCLGAFATPATQHLDDGRQRKCRQQPSFELTLANLCGACIFAAEQAEYHSARNVLVQEMWQLHQCRAPIQKVLETQQKLTELEAIPRETMESFPFRPVEVPRRRKAEKVRSRGSLLRHEVSAESIIAPWQFGEEREPAEVEKEWTEAEPESLKACISWDSDWQADDVVLR